VASIDAPDPRNSTTLPSRTCVAKNSGISVSVLVSSEGELFRLDFFLEKMGLA
jgi:hypothetical protein